MCRGLLSIGQPKFVSLDDHVVRMSCTSKRLSCIRQVCCEIKYSMSHTKIAPEDLWQFFQNDWELFNQILHAH